MLETDFYNIENKRSICYTYDEISRLVCKMKNLIISFLLLVINVLLTCIIGITKLQEYLSLLIYFLPILINIFIIVSAFGKNRKKALKILFYLLLLFIIFLISVSLMFYYRGSFVSSIIALCTFEIIFDIIPLVIAIICIVVSRVTGDGSVVLKNLLTR